eukprot:7387408-Prymnesium_polylepis.1
MVVSFSVSVCALAAARSSRVSSLSPDSYGAPVWLQQQPISAKAPAQKQGMHMTMQFWLFFAIILSMLTRPSTSRSNGVPPGVG